MTWACVAVLAGGLAVGGNDPGQGAGKTAQAPVGLTVAGRWKGTWVDGPDKVCPVEIKGGVLRKYDGAGLEESSCAIAPEGEGRASVTLGTRACPAICKLEGRRVWVCFDRKGSTRPASFNPGGTRVLLILRRVEQVPGVLFDGLRPNR